MPIEILIMTLSTQSHFESCATTTSFGLGSCVAIQPKSAGMKTVVIALRPTQDSNPEMTQGSVNRLLSKLSEKPGFDTELRKARGEVADWLYGSNDRSLKSLRLRAGLSQVELSNMIQTTQPHYAKIEAGKTQPTIAMLRRLSDALNVDMNTMNEAIP